MALDPKSFAKLRFRRKRLAIVAAASNGNLIAPGSHRVLDEDAHGELSHRSQGARD